jgi:uncharacterized phage protein gp47/JayE
VAESGYFAPYIDDAGLHVPTYNSILQENINQIKSIYGDIYLENDSADYQLVANLSLKIFDTYQAAQLAYNNRSPVTAIGTGLDLVVKMNGIRRKIATYSTCQVTITGTSGTAINSGIVQDIAGNKWDLPSIVTIPLTGSALVSAKCETIGPIYAGIGDISIIVTPTAGWESVTNEVEAVMGLPVEIDSELRARQYLSVALPSHSLFIGTVAGVANIPGVTRYKGYENTSNVTDSNGIPGHTICMVVEGALDSDIAWAIYANKGGGCGTYGTTTIAVLDPYSQITTNIHFYRPEYIDIDVLVQLTALTGYTSAVEDNMKAAIATYLDSLQIGEDVTISALYAVAMSVTDIKSPAYSISAILIGAAGGANQLGLYNVGSGYSVEDNVPTTGGSGKGATVDILDVASVSRSINSVQIHSPGYGYVIGDILFVQHGTNGQVRVRTFMDPVDADVVIAFNQVSRGSIDNVTIEVL